MKKTFFYPEIWFLTAAAVFTRFWHLSSPARVIFDETHFGLYATKYLSHEYYFDIHPPLGKLLVALFSWIGGVSSGFSFELNAPYEDPSFVALRFLPAFLGALLVPLAYLFVKELGFSRRAAFVAGFLVLFDNALLVQSRFTMLDIPLLFFILLSLYFFILARKTTMFSGKWYTFYTACGLALGAAISTKWMGFGALGIVWFFQFLHGNFFAKPRAQKLFITAFLVVLPIVLYLGVFSVHFALLSDICQENCGYVTE
ncbi:MAG TPA: phospholipid carrier-dependent glycosyltransferase [Candidatus Paceibacterota bacterium]